MGRRRDYIISVIAILFFYSTLYTENKVATLEDIKGEVLVQKSGTKGWIVGTNGMRLQGGDKIRTRSQSEAKIVWDDGNLVKLTSFTEFVIIKSTISPETKSETTILDLRIGKVFSRVKKAMTPDSSFEIITPSAICGVRSTVWSIEVTGEEKTIITTYEGKIFVSAKNVSVTVDEGFLTIVEKGKPPEKPKEMDEKDKKEWEKQEDIIGKVIRLNIHTPEDNIDTEDETVLVSGITDPDVTLLINDINVKPDSVGKFETKVKLHEGENIIIVKATDSTGKTIEIPRKVKRKKRETVPPLLSVELDDGITVDVDTITIKGTTDIDAKITINGLPVEVSTNGSFSRNINLKEGENIITIVSSDKTGNTTTVTRKVMYKLVDIVPPILTITEPIDNYCSKTDVIQVCGMTEAGAKININNTGDISVGDNGLFCKEIKLKEGLNIISVVAKDNAGNISSPEIRKVTVSTCQLFLNINQPSQTTFTTDNPYLAITGTTCRDAKISIRGVNVLVDANGSFVQTINLAEGLNSIIIKSVDPCGNVVSQTINATLKMIPCQLIVSKPDDNTTVSTQEIYIIGNVVSCPNARVEVNKIPIYANIDSFGDGNFTTSYKLTPGLNTLVIEVFDKSGKLISTPVTRTIYYKPYEPTTGNLNIEVQFNY